MLPPRLLEAPSHLTSNHARYFRPSALIPSAWGQPFTRVPITVERDGANHVVGEGMPFVDRKLNLRIRDMSASTPLGEYVRTLVTQRVLCCSGRSGLQRHHRRRQQPGARGARRCVHPARRPAAGAEPAVELLGLAARIYAAAPADRAALADQLTACVLELGGTAT